MLFSYLAAAAVLSSFGNVYCETLPCTNDPGNLFIFHLDWPLTEDSVFKIKGYSGTLFTQQKIGEFGGILHYSEFYRISVYHCSLAIQKAYHMLKIKHPSWNPTSLAGDEFFVSVTHDQYQLLIDEVGNAVERVCRAEAGYVYISMEPSIVRNGDGKDGRVYMVEGYSGDPLSDYNLAGSKEIMRAPVRVCEYAITSIFLNVELFSMSNPEIKRLREYGNNVFYVAELRQKDFINIVKKAIFPVLMMIPPKDWLPCGNHTEGYLYIMTLHQDREDGSSYYRCDRMFGSSGLIHRNLLAIKTPEFDYVEYQRYRVSDCAKALEQAKAVANHDLDKPWKTLKLMGDECYEVFRHEIITFEEVIGSAIEEYRIEETVTAPQHAGWQFHS